MSVDGQLRRVADELEIRNLLARIAQGADDGDLKDYVQLFAEDGSWQGPDGGVRKGHADILASAQERRASGIQGPGTNTRHVVTNIVIQLNGDTATGKSYYQYYGNAQATPDVLRIGEYFDEFLRTPKGWKMAKRVIVGAMPPQP